MAMSRDIDTDEAWEAKCICGWQGSEDEGFVHQREHRVTVTFRMPRPRLDDSERPARTVADAIARSSWAVPHQGEVIP